MNTEVQATGMTVTAKAETGLVITNSNGGTGEASVTAKNTNANLLPTSTKDASTWYHSQSSSASENDSDGNYDTLSLKLSDTDEGVGYEDKNNNNTYDSESDSAYYLKNKFTIKSSTSNAVAGDLLIKKVEVTSGTATALEKSLRVAVVINDATYIFAPVTGATDNYAIKGVDADKVTLSTTNVKTNITSVNSTGVGVNVYVYYEGEDESCISTNLASVATLTVSVTFGYADAT